MAISGRATKATKGGKAQGAFVPGTAVIVSLNNPREKFWGAVLELSQAGLSVCGVELNSFESVVSLLRTGDPASPSEVFFPMHRVERVEADRHNGNLPSLSERFLAGTGHSAQTWFAAAQVRSVAHR
jgi:hypothetical protein